MIPQRNSHQTRTASVAWAEYHGWWRKYSQWAPMPLQQCSHKNTNLNFGAVLPHWRPRIRRRTTQKYQRKLVEQTEAMDILSLMILYLRELCKTLLKWLGSSRHVAIRGKKLAQQQQWSKSIRSRRGRRFPTLATHWCQLNREIQGRHSSHLWETSSLLFAWFSRWSM